MLELLFKPRICELGKIKIGKKSDQERQSAGGGTWRAPEKIDHFLITTLGRTPKGDLVIDHEIMAELLTSHGDDDAKLRRIPIYVLSNEIEDCLLASWVCYAGKKIAARSDGERVTKFIDLKSGEILAAPEISEWKPEYANLKGKKGEPLFKLHSTFNCVIASKSGRWGGVYKFRTTSKISGEQLYGSLLHIKQLTGGVLRGLPLSMVVRPLQVAPDGKVTTVYVVHVELRGADLHEIHTRALEQKRYEVEHVSEIRKADEQYRLLLAAPGESETDDDAAEIVDEFHPENVEAAPAPPAEHDPVLDEIADQEFPATVKPTELNEDAKGLFPE
jgi:hypothetical protein